ncbi:MAG: Trehalose/maltose import ATP-binding protein MalK [Methanosaeta sp. PtaU1.Bin112]|nr:MAG: Trehalose/maltose import ATP-binding protein MalK [Methanosaeta sp. PtaU1.Bin112]
MTRYSPCQPNITGSGTVAANPVLTDKAVIQTFDLTKYYGNFLAVDHLNFSVQKGETFGFLGPNGSGKTTTIRMLVGLSKPTEGRASILGYDILTSMAEAKRSIGVVPDVSNLYDELSARNNLLFMARLYGVARDLREAKADELLKIFGLYERRDDPFGTFSRGMKRALTIAAALIHSPKILFLDEPTTGLDVVAAQSLRNLISNLHSQGQTIFLTTHYLEEADRLCDRIAILVKGKIIKIDTPLELKNSAKGKAAIEITFTGNIRTRLDELSIKIPGTKIYALDDDKVRICGGDPAKIFEGAFQFAKDAGIGLEFVNSIRPSLEDAFMRITGLSPKIMAIEKTGR